MKSLRIILSILIPILVVGFGFNILYRWNYIQHTQHYPDEFNIPKLHVGYDADKNRVDDSEDIVEGAKVFVAKNPTYEPLTEYASGFPNKNAGSNGDPVAYALTYAGYDMQKLVYDDIMKNPEAYDSSRPQAENIAFRDVKNLETYFSRYADKHDADYYNLNDWQAGDIVFFERNHCAVVADRVNDKGVRFVIHMFWDKQAGYFQDILETNAWGKVTGHYRVSKRMLSPKTDNPNTKQLTKTKITEE